MIKKAGFCLFWQRPVPTIVAEVCCGEDKILQVFRIHEAALAMLVKGADKLLLLCLALWSYQEASGLGLNWFIPQEDHLTQFGQSVTRVQSVEVQYTILQ